ncbi:tRNA/rRNA methyltransferase [Musicola paradisiaca]|uniref:tRNA/rRNA methyltransferase (SpoU) n=1 Tax=Musicola paradisiaca (strain Ech703) TaxID=579405 RepID=C6CAZ6_MUSP7|nr:tRNA/rRNA methyltransferase [Musicola paradisiaca]ACS84696.1 tRNA/rRNA methyltransferase (SpoU) [Musicola paradisiaca Ech703]
MSDELSGKSGKVRVMYVRSEDSDDKNTSGKNKRSSDKRRDGAPREAREKNRPRRDGAMKGGERPARRETYDSAVSPWKTVSRAADESAEQGGISGKSQIDPEQLRRQRAEETRVYGENACQALFNSRPDAIVRAWFLQEVTPRFREALRWMAANRKAYHVVDNDELTRASGTEHHGGVCFLIKKRRGLDVQTYLPHAPEKDCVLALEDVGNPHNLGGIVRSCAHFGVNGVLVRDASQLESGAAVRTAEGGAEHVKAIQSDNLIDALSQFRKAGYTIVTTSSHKGTALYDTQLPARTVIVLGQESDGLSDGAWQQGDMKVSINGTGNVESLNISVATGILLAEWWRHNRA